MNRRTSKLLRRFAITATGTGSYRERVGRYKLLKRRWNATPRPQRQYLANSPAFIPH